MLKIGKRLNGAIDGLGYLEVGLGGPGKIVLNIMPTLPSTFKLYISEDSKT